VNSIMLLHVPEDWRIERLGQLFSERKEKVSDEDFLPLSVSKNGIVPQMEHVAKSDDSSNRKKVCAGDFVINSRSDRKGSSGLSEYDGSVSLISIVLDPRHGHPRFLHHLLKSYAFQEEFFRFGHGIVADLWTTRFSEMKGIQVGLPDIAIQRAIADFLDRESARIDQLIEKKQQMIELLEEKRGVVALECLSGGVDGFDWCSHKQSIVFRFKQASWTEMRVKGVVGFMTSGSRGWSNLLTPEGEIFIQSGNIARRMEIDLRNVQHVQPQTGAEADRTLVKEHDVLVCITGGRTGAVGFVRAIDERAYINQHVCLLRARSGIIFPELLAQILWSEIGQKQIELCQYGVKQGLGFNEVANIRLPVPPSEQQPRITSEITAATGRIDAATEVIEHSLGRLREFHSALITAAVTGQIDVATWGKRGTTDRRLDDMEVEMAAASPPGRKQARA
jgi:type I restriction enzyme S subunit